MVPFDLIGDLYLRVIPKLVDAAVYTFVGCVGLVVQLFVICYYEMFLLKCD